MAAKIAAVTAGIARARLAATATSTSELGAAATSPGGRELNSFATSGAIASIITGASFSTTPMASALATASALCGRRRSATRRGHGCGRGAGRAITERHGLRDDELVARIGVAVDLAGELVGLGLIGGADGERQRGSLALAIEHEGGVVDLGLRVAEVGGLHAERGGARHDGVLATDDLFRGRLEQAAGLLSASGESEGEHQCERRVQEADGQFWNLQAHINLSSSL